MSTPIKGFVVAFQTPGGTWEPQYATSDRQRLAEFLERVIPYDNGLPVVIRISRIMIDECEVLQ